MLTERQEDRLLSDIDMNRFYELNPELLKERRKKRKCRQPKNKKSPAPKAITSLPGYALYARCKARAKRKGMAFHLTIEDCAELAPCVYCGGKSTGWDRLDSDLGYVPQNVAPACGACNTMKMRMSVAEFLAHVRKILQHHESEEVL